MEPFKIPPIGITRKYPELGTGPVPTDIYHDPVLYEKELEAVFKCSWFLIGRIEQIANPGEYFIADLPTFGYSVVITRDKDGVIHGFRNVCRHRGNVIEHRRAGKCSVFTCRFHGWSYDLKGNLARIRDEEGFFDLDKSKLNLHKVPTQIWQGFIFVSPEDNPTQTLDDYLGQQGRDLAGYPFELGTQCYQYEAEVNCNWKLVIDSFSEVYHIPVLHPRSIAPTMMTPGNPNGRMLDMEIKGPHRTNSHWSVFNEPANPVQKLAYQNIPGPSLVSARGAEALPKALNPTRAKNWSVDLAMFFPATGFVISAGMYAIHQSWPLGPNRCYYQQRGYIRKAENAAQRFGQENSLVEFRDLILEDLSTLERVQRALDSGQLSHFHFHDHEVALRHQHKVICDRIAALDRRRAEEKKQ